MKVLAISASPRKGGNSEQLCDQFLKGAEAAGFATEKVRLAELRIWPCEGCGGCIEKGRCVTHVDDMAKLLHQMQTADVIALATPVWFRQMAGQLKTMIDRSLPKFREISDKRFYFLLSMGSPDAKDADETLVGLRAFLKCLPNVAEAGCAIAAGVHAPGDVCATEAFALAEQMGKELNK